MFQIRLRQLVSQQKLYIDIFQEEDGPEIHVSKRYDFKTQIVGPALIFVNVHFGEHLDKYQTRTAARWFTIAANVAEQLDSLLHSRDDLRRRIAAKLWADDTVDISFEDFN